MGNNDVTMSNNKLLDPEIGLNAASPGLLRELAGKAAHGFVSCHLLQIAAVQQECQTTQLRSASTRRRRRWGSGLAGHELSGGSGSAACYRLVPLLEPLTRMRVPKTLKLPAHAGHIVLETQVIEPSLDWLELLGR